MTPAAQGRHCAACDKVVVDFTRMTDRELLAYLEQASGSTCGRFRVQQLNRPLALPTTDHSGWRRPFLALATLLGIEAASASAALAQTVTQPKPLPRAITLGMVAPAAQPVQPSLPLSVVRGVVLDSTTQQPLQGVTVLVAGTTTGVATGVDGQFELRLPEGFRQQAATLQFTYIGYRMQEQHVKLPQNNTLTAVLAPDGQMLSGEVVIVGGAYAYYPWYSPRGFWQRLTRPFRR